ncbi:MAG TPA: hypothetical protein VGR42_05360 [Casimicrobiaceae bacterium]|nr:hypothetical protein [Casimicrobiaceae bacterium]
MMPPRILELQREADQLQRFEARRGVTRKPDPLEIQTYHIVRQRGGGVVVDTLAARYRMINAQQFSCKRFCNRWPAQFWCNYG